MEQQYKILLAEAMSRVKEIDSLLSGLRLSIARVPHDKVAATFQRASSLISESEALKRRICKTEEVTLLSGTSLTEVKNIISFLEFRIDFYSSVASREALSEEVVELVNSSITQFQSTRDSLVAKYDQSLWEIELL